MVLAQRMPLQFDGLIGYLHGVGPEQFNIQWSSASEPDIVKVHPKYLMFFCNADILSHSLNRKL